MEREPTRHVAGPGRSTMALGAGDFTGSPARPGRGRRAEDLHVCPSCDSSLVHPVDWAPAAGRRWLVSLRCPDCEWTGGGTYPQSVVDRYDEVLDQGVEAILKDLTQLTHANMEEQIGSFVAALESDLILPEDF